MSEACTLCKGEETRVFAKTKDRVFFVCLQCDLKYAERRSRLSRDDEKKRYSFHQNDIHDLKYQEFVQPLVHAVMEFGPAPARGLDFGCGSAPVSAYLLERKGYEMELYDPLVRREKRVLGKVYDFVMACEVAEHFYEPHADFTLMKTLLRPKGILFLMTLLWTEKVRFEEWYYPRDPTHVSFYSRRTFEWIREHFAFSEVAFRGERVVVLR